MKCKGICDSIKVKHGNPAGGRYANGQKRCQICEKWFLTERIRCECCECKLRSKPRNSAYKAKLKAKLRARK